MSKWKIALRWQALAGAALVMIGCGTLTDQGGSSETKLQGSRPNIVFIITDDQGYGEIGAHGNPLLKTPNLDRLHRESVRFTQFHVSPTCAPTRAALLTGKHEFRSGVTHTIFERERLSLKARTLAERLQAAKYRTGIFGKWHLGDEDDYLPRRRGFDESFIHGAGGIGQTYPGSCGDAPNNSYFDPWIWHNDRFVKTQGYCTDVFFEKAADWIEERAAKKERFFAWISPNVPHDPFISPGAEWEAPYKNAGLSTNAVRYYSMIAHLDAAVGKLLERLDRLGVTEETLVVFMTDNGHSVGDVFNAGMRGRKGGPYEGGTRVPSFWRWPARLPSGVDCDALTAHVDFLPTVLHLAGERAPSGIDGRSLVPLLENSLREVPHPAETIWA
ncbi:MAG: arylsulfatase, partial [Limisphaerales bacterium]